MKALIITVITLATLSANYDAPKPDRATIASVNSIMANIRNDVPAKPKKAKAKSDFQWAEWMTKSYKANK